MTKRRIITMDEHYSQLRPTQSPWTLSSSPAKSIFCAHRNRQTYWTSTSPSAAASGPVQPAEPLGRGLIQQRQDAFARLRRVLRLSVPLTHLVETREPPVAIAHGPLRYGAGGAPDRPSVQSPSSPCRLPPKARSAPQVTPPILACYTPTH